MVDDEPPISSAPPSLRPQPLWDPRGAVGRLAVAIPLGVMATVIAPADVALGIRAVVGWDVAAATLVAINWWGILRRDSKATAEHAAAEDPGRMLVFLIALASSVFSLFAAAVVLREARHFSPREAPVWTVLALLAVVLSWLLTHTAYSLRYAHLYYRHGLAQGLVFPGGRPPAEIDFAYFSFTLGMCFQVSDVSIQSSRIRRTVLGHALLSFVYNTTILALALNLMFTLLAGKSGGP